MITFKSHLTDRELVTEMRATVGDSDILRRFEALLDLQEELAPLIAVLDEHDIRPEQAEGLSKLIEAQRHVAQAAAWITQAQGALTLAANAVDHFTQE